MTPNASETELKDAIIDAAHTFGWKVVHFRPAQTAKGWRTPVQGDGKGWVDLTLVHHTGWFIFAELKDKKGKLSNEQVIWAGTLMSACEQINRAKYVMWRPEDWPEIIETLSFGAAHG